MALAELGQQTASGMLLTGVKQMPPKPLLNSTPVKNNPKTTRSKEILLSSSPRTV